MTWDDDDSDLFTDEGDLRPEVAQRMAPRRDTVNVEVETLFKSHVVAFVAGLILALAGGC